MSSLPTNYEFFPPYLVCMSFADSEWVRKNVKAIPLLPSHHPYSQPRQGQIQLSICNCANLQKIDPPMVKTSQQEPFSCSNTNQSWSKISETRHIDKSSRTGKAIAGMFLDQKKVEIIHPMANPYWRRASDRGTHLAC
jgi:hypothetical protein